MAGPDSDLRKDLLHLYRLIQGSEWCTGGHATVCNEQKAIRFCSDKIGFSYSHESWRTQTERPCWPTNSPSKSLSQNSTFPFPRFDFVPDSQVNKRFLLAFMHSFPPLTQSSFLSFRISAGLAKLTQLVSAFRTLFFPCQMIRF